MLTINFKNNATDNDKTAFAQAVKYAGLAMTIEMTSDAISRLDKKIENKANKYTIKQVDAFKDERELLQIDLETYQEDADSVLPVYESVKESIVEGGSIPENVDNILRCIAAAENSKLEKYALKRLGTVEIYNNLMICHDISNSNDSGIAVISKSLRAAYDAAQDAIQRELRETLSLEESAYTEKTTIRFNKTDMRLIHETFVRGFSNVYDVSKDEDGNEVSRVYKGVKVSHAIATKKSKDGDVKYNFSKFNETVARLVIGKLAK